MPEKNRQPSILVVDDDEGLLVLIEKALRRKSLQVTTATSSAAALEWLSGNRPDLALIDLKLAGGGVDRLLARLIVAQPSIPFSIITGQGDERVAVEMMKRGAFDYLIKDQQFLDLLPVVVPRALERIENDRKLVEREGQMALFVEYAPAAIALFDTHMRYLVVSRRWLSDYGLNGQGIIGRSHYEVMPEIPEHWRKIHARCLAGATERSEAELFILASGRKLWLRWEVRPWYNASGDIGGLVIISEDITERKELERQVLEISEREQSRIGQDLHDGLCQHLAGIEFRLLALKESVASGKPNQAAEVSAVAKLIRDAIEQTRTLSRGLSPVMLEPGGLMNALQELALLTSRNFKVDCSFHCPAPVLIHNNAVATHLYRIAQEAVHNAIRHGRSKSILLSLVSFADRILLGVKDDGAGIPLEIPRHKGMGLRVMHYRAGMVGGSLAVQQESEGGTSVLCSLHMEATKAPLGLERPAHNNS